MTVKRYQHKAAGLPDATAQVFFCDCTSSVAPYGEGCHSATIYIFSNEGSATALAETQRQTAQQGLAASKPCHHRNRTSPLH